MLYNMTQHNTALELMDSTLIDHKELQQIIIKKSYNKKIIIEDLVRGQRLTVSTITTQCVYYCSYQ